ncbi:MAG: nuclear transport factor 2 family protein [Microthrixaceae bacterium]
MSSAAHPSGPGDDRPSELWDLEQLRQLKARYLRAVDTKDWDLLEEVLTEDAVLEVAAGRRVGRAEILRVMRERLGPLVTVHHGHMPELSITGADTATGVWAMDDLLVGPVEPGGPSLRRHGYGHYHEAYVRLDGAWRIRHLRLERIEVPGD